jgi:hypothetical protein
VLHYFSTCGGMANSVVELTAVLANLAPVAASWCALCSNRSGFEGRGIVVDSDPYEVQWQAWRRPVPACLTTSEQL